MARITKILKNIPELMVLFKGMSVAARSVIATLSLVGVIIYICAIVFRQLCRGTGLEDEYFSSVPDSMSTLLLTSTTPDLLHIVKDDFGKAGIGFAILYFAFIMFTSFLVLNLLIGVLVNVVSVVATGEREQLQVDLIRYQLVKIFGVIDEDHNNTVSKKEFIMMLHKPQVVQALTRSGVDSAGLVDFVDLIFEDDLEPITLNDLLAFIIQLRGGNHATVKDLVDMRRIFMNELQRTETRIFELFQLAFPEKSKKVAHVGSQRSDASKAERRREVR